MRRKNSERLTENQKKYIQLKQKFEGLLANGSVASIKVGGEMAGLWIGFSDKEKCEINKKTDGKFTDSIKL